MIKREKHQKLIELVESFPAVAIIGPQQVGETTITQEIATNYDSIYLDLESATDRA